MEIIEDYAEFFLLGNYMVVIYCANDVIFDFDDDLEIVSFILN